jgi:hypothetical protein
LKQNVAASLSLTAAVRLTGFGVFTAFSESKKGEHFCCRRSPCKKTKQTKKNDNDKGTDSLPLLPSSFFSQWPLCSPRSDVYSVASFTTAGTTTLLLFHARTVQFTTTTTMTMTKKRWRHQSPCESFLKKILELFYKFLLFFIKNFWIESC